MRSSIASIASNQDFQGPYLLSADYFQMQESFHRQSYPGHHKWQRNRQELSSK